MLMFSKMIGLKINVFRIFSGDELIDKSINNNLMTELIAIQKTIQS